MELRALEVLLCTDCPKANRLPRLLDEQLLWTGREFVANEVAPKVQGVLTPAAD